ncbi:MAG: hypothetical protein ACRDZ4_04435, partial [Egibacteraceae bacterium]
STPSAVPLACGGVGTRRAVADAPGGPKPGGDLAAIIGRRRRREQPTGTLRAWPGSSRDGFPAATSRALESWTHAGLLAEEHHLVVIVLDVHSRMTSFAETDSTLCPCALRAGTRAQSRPGMIAARTTPASARLRETVLMNPDPAISTAFTPLEGAQALDRRPCDL